MADGIRTPKAEYRLEAKYRVALRELAARFAAEGKVQHPSEANAIRVLVAQECERRGIKTEDQP